MLVNMESYFIKTKIIIMKTKMGMFLIAVLAVILPKTNVLAQGFAGFRASKNMGVNSVFNNPANMSTSKNKWNFNLGGFQGSAYLQGSYDSVNLQKVYNSKGAEMPNWSHSFLGSGNIEIDLLGPSAMYKINDQQAIALTTRTRFLASGDKIGGMANYNTYDSIFSFTSSHTQKLNFNAWKEIGLSFSNTIVDNSIVKITAGVSAKYLTGEHNFYYHATPFNVAGFDGANSYLTNTNGTIKIGGTSEEDGKENKAHGFGMDLGFLIEKKSISGEKPYDIRFGASLMDVGAIHYKTNMNNHGHYNVNIANTTKFYTQQLENKSNAEIKQILDANSSFTNITPSTNNYKVSLPTNLNLTVDYAINKHLFVEASTRINLLGDAKIYESTLSNYIAVTPRMEYSNFSLYAPISYNEVSGWNAGLAMKKGIFYLGLSKSLTNEKDKFGLSAQAGLHFSLNCKASK
jgi:hypothetical protein